MDSETAARIVALEARIAALEARIAVLESRQPYPAPVPYHPTPAMPWITWAVADVCPTKRLT